MLSLTNILFFNSDIYYLSQIYFPPSLMISPTYLRCGRTGFHNSTAVRLWGGQGCVGNFNPHDNPCSNCGLRPVFRFCHRGLRSYEPCLHCDSLYIFRLTGRPVHDFCVCLAACTTRSIQSISSDLHRNRYFASVCEIPYLT